MQINDFKIILKLYKKVLDQYIYSHILEGGENTAKWEYGSYQCQTAPPEHGIDRKHNKTSGTINASYHSGCNWIGQQWGDDWG